MLLPLPGHPPCPGVLPPKPRGKWVRCPTCWAFLLRWVNCLAGATGALTCYRCLELGLLKTCDIWWCYDFIFSGWTRFRDGAAYNIKIRKNDNFRRGHYPRVGVPRDGRFDLLGQTREMIRLLGTGPHPDCKQRFDHSITCDVCYPLFPRRIKRGTEFDLTRQATSAEISAMIIAGLADVGLILNATVDVYLGGRCTCASSCVCNGSRLTAAGGVLAGAAGRETGLASRILEASFRTETPKMFAALSLLVATGVMIFWLFNALSRWLLGPWHASESARQL